MARRIEKPWGFELIWAETDRYVGKVLHIDAGHRLSLQYHQVKDEALYVISGQVEIELSGDDGVLRSHLLSVGDYLHIAPGHTHRMRAIETCELVEVSTPELDDVVRLEDDYGRGTGD